MSLFFPEDEERFTPPGRKRGFPRYRELLEGNVKDFFLTGFLALIFLIPLGLGLGWAVLSRSSLAALVCGLTGGAISGPGITGMFDLILRRLRDDRGDWWLCWKRSLRQNWRASLLPGAVQGLFLGMVIFMVALMLWEAVRPTAFSLVLLLVSCLLFLMLSTVWWSETVLFEQKPFERVRNAVFFVLLHIRRALPVALLQLTWWLVFALFLPWSAFLVPFLSIWYILFLSEFLLYEDLDDAFHIEERIGERFPERVGQPAASNKVKDK